LALTTQKEILKSGNIEIVYPVGAQSRIDARLAAKSEIRWRGETCGIKPAA
jgi:hypothetical protein